MRRKLNHAADPHRDFLPEIEGSNLAMLDEAIALVCRPSAAGDKLHFQIPPMIVRVEYGLYRPFPDAWRVDRAALL